MGKRMIMLLVAGGFLVMITAISIWLTAYVYGSHRKKGWLGIGLGVFVVLLAITLGYQFNENALITTWMYWPGRWISVETYGLMIGIIVTLAIMAVLALVTALVNWRASKKTEVDGQSRRAFLRKAVLAVPAVSLVGASIESFEGASQLEITHHKLGLKGWPRELNDYRIGQMSDMHIGPFINCNDFEKALALVQAEKPNRLVITGDIIDDLAWMPQVRELVAKYNKIFPDGITYILGNHEYFHDVDYVLGEMRKSGATVLRNSSVKIHSGSKEVYLAGVDYPFSQKFWQRQAFFEKAMTGIPKEATTILLAHHPDFIEQGFNAGIPLTLGGHTHGGQLVVAGTSLIPLGTTYWKGLYKQNGLYGYISNGTGHWFPMRVNCPREISVFELYRA